MKKVGAALGMSEVHAQVTINEIIATCHRGNIYRTEVAQTATIGVNSDRIKDIQNFCDSLEKAPADITQDDLEERISRVEKELDLIESRGHLYSDAINALCAALACGAFAFLNNCGPKEIAVVLVGAFAGQYVRRKMLHHGLNVLATTMIAAAVAAFVYMGIVNLLLSAGLVHTIAESGYISAVLFLVPGFPLITAALDLSHLDFSAGMSRLAYALMIMISAALSVWAVSAFMGLDPTPAAPLMLEPWARTLLRLAAGAIGVWGFAMIFNSPWNVALVAAGIGMIANTARLLMVDAGVFAQGAAFLAGLLVGVLANLIAPRLNMPRITVSVPAVVIMIPGAAGYRAIYYFNSGDAMSALTYGVEAIFVVIAVVVGLTFARSVTDRHWFDLTKNVSQ